MKYNFDYKNFILVTNCFNEGEDCLYFTCNIGRGEIYKALKVKGIYFDEIYDIKESEIHLYCFDPVYGDEKLENNIKAIAETYQKEIHQGKKNYAGF